MGDGKSGEVGENKRTECEEGKEGVREEWWMERAEGKEREEEAWEGSRSKRETASARESDKRLV